MLRIEIRLNEAIFGFQQNTTDAAEEITLKTERTKHNLQGMPKDI